MTCVQEFIAVDGDHNSERPCVGLGNFQANGMKACSACSLTDRPVPRWPHFVPRGGQVVGHVISFFKRCLRLVGMFCAFRSLLQQA